MVATRSGKCLEVCGGVPPTFPAELLGLWKRIAPSKWTATGLLTHKHKLSQEQQPMELTTESTPLLVYGYLEGKGVVFQVSLHS